MKQMGRPRCGSMRYCEHCKKAFYAFCKSKQKYCTLECYRLSNAIGDKKTCARCGTVKPISEFGKTNSTRDKNGYQAYCRPCGLQKNAEWRAKNRPRADGLPSRACVRVPKTAEQKRIEKNAKAREYRKNNKDKVLMWNRLRRHRERGAGPTPSRYEIERLICLQDARCVYCSKQFFTDPFEIDHKTPVSRGGKNHISNLHLVCPTCNMRKSSKTHEEYMHRLGMMG